MNSRLCVWGCGLVLAVVAAAAAGQTTSGAKSGVQTEGVTPILVELFTSEGCSSCPPADALLMKIDTLPSEATKSKLIVLSEHVDYWNHDGWKDAYSSSFYTERQQDYEKKFGVHEAYTPQMVVDGAAQMNGSDARAVADALQAAKAKAKIAVKISQVQVDGKNLKAHVEVDGLPADGKSGKADVVVALALDHAKSHVSAGENKGHDIEHVSVAEAMEKVGTVEKGRGFERDVVVKTKAEIDVENLRVIAFVQVQDEGPVVGAAMVNGAQVKPGAGADKTVTELLPMAHSVNALSDRVE
jgi:hypothetical protein